MLFDPENPVFQLCAQGIELEGSDPARAKELYELAWKKASTGTEKFTAAHYLARMQPDVVQKLQWDECALRIARETEGEILIASLPSLCLNVGKGYEDLENLQEARKYYTQGLKHVSQLDQTDGYVQLIRNGLLSGLDRIG